MAFSSYGPLCWFLIFTLFCGFAGLLVQQILFSWLASVPHSTSSYLHSGRLDFLILSLLVGSISYCFHVQRSFFLLLPLYRFSFVFSVLLQAGRLFSRFLLFLLFLFLLFSMPASSVVEGPSVAHSPSFPPCRLTLLLTCNVRWRKTMSWDAVS